MDESRKVRSDATPFPASINRRESISEALDSIMNELSEDDYRSVLFLLLKDNEICNYLYLINTNKSRMKEKFREKYYEHPYKENVLVEILGTMQKFRLLTLLNSCQHYFKNEVENLNLLDCFWKCLYTICEQLSDAQVVDLREKLCIPTTIPIICAEQLFCQAMLTKSFDRNNLSRLENIFQQHYPKCYELLMTYKESSKVSYYPMTHCPTGLAVIFCHTEFETETESPSLPPRTDSIRDAEGLNDIWWKFGFCTVIYYNKPDVEVKKIITEISSKDHSSYDAFVLCYLSHGDEGVVYASNCRPINISWMVSSIANNCPSLVNKPKLFIIQACQGNKIMNDISNHAREEPSERIEIDLAISRSCTETPIFSDFLLVLSTIEKFASYWIPGGNSWFIGEFIKVLNEDWENLTMLSIITKVIKLVSQKEGLEYQTQQRCKQIPVVKSTLRHELKLKKRR